MKAISPMRSVRSCYEAVRCISDQSLSITRNKPSMEESVGALCDMNDCYSKLKELVPSIPQNKSVSQVEILQHVIDYIFDLQIALEDESSATTTPDLVLSLKVQRNTSPLHSGQEDSRARKKVWDRYLEWERRGLVSSQIWARGPERRSGTGI